MRRFQKLVRLLDWLNTTQYWIGYFSGILVGSAAILFCSGCTPHVHPIDVTGERVDEVPQRVQDLLFTCDLCGQPAKMSETENWYRCEECSRPRRTFRPRRLETMIVKGN